MFFETKQGNGGLPFDPIKAIVTPRPIGWISTLDSRGVVNLAPYSFFNLVSARPAVVGFAGEGVKDSTVLAQETGEFVCNLVSADLLDAMNLTSLPLPRGESELGAAALATEPSGLVRPPRVRGVAAALECRFVDLIPVRTSEGALTNWNLVLGHVVAVFIDDRYLVNGRFDTGAARPAARCGYRDYTTIDRLFELQRYSDG